MILVGIRVAEETVLACRTRCFIGLRYADEGRSLSLVLRHGEGKSHVNKLKLSMRSCAVVLLP